MRPDVIGGGFRAYCSCRQDVAWHQCLPFTHSHDKIRDTEDQVLGCGVLAELSVDVCLHSKDFVQFVGRNGDRALHFSMLVGCWYADRAAGTTYHRAEGIWRFADVELLMIALALSCRHVVDDGIAPDVVHGFILPNAKAFLANDDSEFALVVDSLGELRVRVNVLSVCNDGREALGEDDGVRRLVDLVGAIEARFVELFGVLGVVLAYA